MIVPSVSVVFPRITFVPKLVAFLVILLIGWLIAKALRKGVDVLLERVGFDRAVERGGVKRALAQSKYDASGLIAAIVYFRLGSPVLFVQERPGLRGRPFRMFKFRTMRDAVGKNGEPLPDEMRLTRLGKVLRASSLDELPELWNVLKGDMSLVGPRPLLQEYLPLYSPNQARRHDVRPGLTGWAQIHGRNTLSWPRKLALDLWYVDHTSFMLDLRIILGTLGQVFRREGIAHAGHATMPPFTGGEEEPWTSR